jgi:multisubunit Na+/H+ antiporter MnhC subunit
MYILLALIAACAIGIAVHFLIGDRSLRGVALAPAVATAAAAVLYTGLQWAGLGEDNVWLWLASIVGGVAVSAVLTVAVTAARRRTDAEKKAALGI